MEDIDLKYMQECLKLAQIAYDKNEVPVGAIIVKDDQVIAKGYNLREIDNNSLSHAEIIAIDNACKNLKTWRLSDCTLYVTLEPCPMCMGAIINSRIKKVVYGCSDPKAGAAGSIIDLNNVGLNHKVEIINGVLEEKCSKILSDFFRKLRKEKNVK